MHTPACPFAPYSLPFLVSETIQSWRAAPARAPRMPDDALVMSGLEAWKEEVKRHWEQRMAALQAHLEGAIEQKTRLLQQVTVEKSELAKRLSHQAEVLYCLFLYFIIR